MRSYRLEFTAVEGVGIGYKLVRRGELNTVAEGVKPSEYVSQGEWQPQSTVQAWMWQCGC